MDYYIAGPGNAINNSIRNNARKLISKTVLNSYFNNAWNTRNRNYNYSVWNENGKIAGFALLYRKGTRLYVSLIGASPGKGIGSRLMQRIIDNAENRGIRKIKLNSVPNALAFYKKFGFKVRSANNEHIMMSRRIGRQQPSPEKKSPSPPRMVKVLRRSTRIASRRMVKK